MAYVDRANADDSEFKIDIRGKLVDAKPTKLPFYKRPKS
ncbi:MAG: glycine cleavage T C-terminal barrel domain-containing protein [Rubripirellula sp.]